MKAKKEIIMVLKAKDGTPRWKKQYQQQTEYDAKNTRKVAYKFNLKTDADILEALDNAPNKQGFVKEAIRFYLANKEKK